MHNVAVKLTANTPLPAYAKPGDAAFDLSLNLEAPITLQPDATAKISFGIAMEIPAGHFGLLVPRSSMAKRGLILANTLGIIDSGYRGEILGVFRNIGTGPETLNPADRLVQMLILPVAQVAFRQVEELSATERGHGGFGSTDTPAAA